MIDMGEKGNSLPKGALDKPKEPKVSYQKFSMTGDKIPQELQDAANGDKCRLEIVVRKIGDNIDTYADDEPRRVEVEIQGLEYIGKAGKISRKEYLAKSEDDRRAYDQEEVDDNSSDEEK